MKTRFTRKSVCSMLILMTVFSMLLSALTFGATIRKKLVRSIKEYDENGTLIYSSNRTFDSKGHIKTSSTYQKLDREDYNSKSTSKYTYWKGTDILKKSVQKSGDNTYTYVYNKKGAPKTYIGQGPSFYEKTIYKSSGKRARSSVTYDKDGRKISEETYDSRGNVKRRTTYRTNGSTYWINYSTKYNSRGDYVKRTITQSSGSVQVITYDKKGSTLKSVFTNPKGTVTTTTYKNKYNKEGYRVEAKVYRDGKFTQRNVYKYTSKEYTIDN